VEYDALGDAQKASLDGPRLKHLAGTLLDRYQAAAARAGRKLRPDYANMLTLVRDGGVSALRNALRDSSQLLPVLAVLGLSGEVGKLATQERTDDRRRPSQ